MNATVISSKKHSFHTIANAEFSGVFDRIVFNRDIPEAVCDYHLFIKYGDKVYMDVLGVGDIVMSFAELQQNKYWKHYYDLSLMLANDKNMVVQELRYSNAPIVYEEERLWYIDTAYLEFDNINGTNKGTNKGTNNIINNSSVCYYQMNPYDLEKFECSSQEDLNTFRKVYMERDEITGNMFEEKSILYKSLVDKYFSIKSGEKVENVDVS
jgi:hypothetical protein